MEMSLLYEQTTHLKQARAIGSQVELLCGLARAPAVPSMGAS